MRERKTALHSKKGFTLVELMIVVVIMGILVAVAIPVYNSVTSNTKATACHSNCEIIEKAATQYLVNGDLERVDFVKKNSPLVISSPEVAKEKLPPEFLACFQDGAFPECPSNETYSIYYDEKSDGVSIKVYCSEHGDMHGKNP